MIENELEIIKACQAGQLERFGLLYDGYIGKIYRFVYFKTSHQETAEDITSQVFMKALEKIKSYNPGKGSFSSWLYTIARNSIIDHYRARKTDENIDTILNLGSTDDLEADMDAKQRLEKVKAGLGKLKPEQREIVIMRVWQEMSYAEIAAALGKSEASCKMAFSRAVIKLREHVPFVALLAMFVKIFELR